MRYIHCHLLFALALQTIRFSGSTPCDDTFGQPWKPSWIENPRQDLRCHLSSICKNESTQVKSNQFDKCCACSSCAAWEGSEIQLFIEYISVLGKSLVLADQASKDTDVYEIRHINGDMTAMPSNLCNWDKNLRLITLYSKEFKSIQKIWRNIVKINFENNKISDLINLSCLEKLDELNLNNNRLTYISNTSFTSLTSLRKVYFSRNLITEIDPGILTAKSLNLFTADFSHNKMSQLDVSNIISMYPFCDFNFKTNKVTKLVNEANFSLDTAQSYGPGFVSFKGNNLETFPDFKTLLNLDNIAQMGKLISSGFDYEEIPLICDCHLAPFMSLAVDAIQTLWQDYMTVKCAGPPDLKGMKVNDVDPQRLICKLKNSDCQTPECNCLDEPNKNTLIVNCQNNDPHNALKSLPSIPKSNLSDFISLDVSGHQITNITNITKWANISMLNVSGNNLLEISTDVAKALENATVDISNNIKLRHLPRTFQYANVCNMYMTNLVIDCDCDSLWIETWLKPQKCINKEHMFNCQLPNDEIKSALMFKSQDIECFSSKFPNDILAGMTVLIIFIILISILIYNFRYELLILSIHLKQGDRRRFLPKYNYDVYLSFNAADDFVTKWVNGLLQENLINARYRVFQADQHLTYGCERNSEVLETISNTCNFLLILSDSYLEQDTDGMRPWTENEWKYGWHNFLKDKYKNLIIINLDHISSFDVNHPQIKAFLRVGCTIDFKNHDRKIMNDICKKLGKPLSPQTKYARCLENMNRKLPKNSVFPAISAYKQTDPEPSDKTPGILTNHKIPMKYLQFLIATDINKNKEFHLKQNKSPKIQRIPEQVKEHFEFYFEDTTLKKTPHIPLFNREKAKNNKHPSKTQTKEKTKNFTQVFNRQTSTGCMQKGIRFAGRHPKPSNPLSGPLSNKANSKSDVYGIQGEHMTYSTEGSLSDTEQDAVTNSEDNNYMVQLDMSIINTEKSSAL